MFNRIVLIMSISAILTSSLMLTFFKIRESQTMTVWPDQPQKQVSKRTNGPPFVPVFVIQNGFVQTGF